MKNSAEFSTLMSIRTLYVGLPKNTTSVGGTLSNTSEANVSADSESKFSTRAVAVHGAFFLLILFWRPI